jgi:hypothetical protein
VADDYSVANGPELASPSPGMQIRFPNRRNFDQQGVNLLLGHTFNLSSVKGCMVGGSLDFQARPLCDIESNDAVGFLFIDNLGNLVPLSDSWNRRFGLDPPDPGLQPSPWSCSNPSLTAANAWPFGPYDLRFLPTAAGGSVNVVDDMNTNGFIDAFAQDETEVDFMNLCVTTRPNCCPRSGSILFPIAVGHAAGNLNFSWLPSCERADDDYELYMGTLPAPGNPFVYNHAPVLCSTNGALTATVPVPAGNRYFMVVPRNGCREGSYGKDWNGAQRPQGSPFCMVQEALEISCP